MSDVTLHFDRKAQKNLEELKKFLNVSSNAAVISRALTLLKVAKIVEETGGQLLTRKGTKTGVISVR